MGHWQRTLRKYAGLETFANVLSYVYFTRNLNSPAPHQAFCGNFRSIVITYESVCKRLSTLDVEAIAWDLMVSILNY